MTKKLHWPVYVGPERDIDLSLNRMFFLMDKLNRPQNKLKNIIHITGTKGKGSTSKFISKILQELGFKVNTYTSPHIHNWNEMIELNNKFISDDLLFETLEQVRPICEYHNIQLTIFEALTIVAMIVFSNSNADYNVIEVGMGGRLDATNIFHDNSPIACVFTPIHLDHKLFLGNTIESIAWNKAHIMKQHIQNVITSSQSTEVQKILFAFAKKLNVQNILAYSKDFEAYKIENNNNSFCFSSSCGDMEINYPSLLGEHQLINASTAIASVMSLGDFQISDQLISSALSKVQHFARMERISNKSQLGLLLSDQSFLYIDGAHNKLSAHALIKFISNFKNENPDYVVIVAIARSAGVENFDMLSVFKESNLIDLTICTRANLESRSEPPERIDLICKELNMSSKVACNIHEALKISSSYMNNKDCLFIATGSLYIARDVEYYNNSI